MISAKELRKVLVCRLSALKELVLTSAVMHTLKQELPNVELHLVTRESYEPLFRSDPSVDMLYGFNPSRGFIGWRSHCHMLSEEGYSLYIDLQNDLRSRLLSKHLRDTPALTYNAPHFKRKLLCGLHINLFPNDYDLLSDFLNVLSPLNLSGKMEIKPHIQLSDFFFSKEIADLQEKSGGKYSVLIPFAEGINCRWDTQNYRHLAGEIVKRYGIYVVVLAGEMDDYIREADFTSDEGILLYKSHFSLEECLHLIRDSLFVVGNDTGLVYIADALGTPTLSILGAGNRETGSCFYSAETRVFEHRLWCRPCSSNGKKRCKRFTRACLKRTRVDDLLKEIENIVREK